MNTVSKPRILYLLKSYLQISQTYIKTELEAIENDYEIKIISVLRPNLMCETHYDCKFDDEFNSKEEIFDYVRDFNPDIIHCHYFSLSSLAYEFSELLNIPFTVRTHSFDVLQPVDDLKFFLPYVNNDYCLRILAFPFIIDHLKEAGVRDEKLVSCYPAIKYSIFHDTSPNGKAVMNTGACLPKKNMRFFIDIAENMPEKQFNLYPLDYRANNLKKYNQVKNNIVNFIDPVYPDLMPKEYKKHEWLVYTAKLAEKTVGWPMAISEAQASGCGVLMPRLRDDIKDYVGGAGFVYDTMDDVIRIISQPYPEEMRTVGFEQAKKSDINTHIHLLTDAWQEHLSC